jgi:hypothetical protein
MIPRSELADSENYEWLVPLAASEGDYQYCLIDHQSAPWWDQWEADKLDRLHILPLGCVTLWLRDTDGLLETHGQVLMETLKSLLATPSGKAADPVRPSWFDDIEPPAVLRCRVEDKRGYITTTHVAEK